MTSGVDAGPIEQLESLLADGAAVIQGLQDLEWWKLPEDALLGATRELEALLRSGFGAQVRAAAEIQQRGLAAGHGFRSAAAMLAALINIPPGQARARMAAAAAVLPPDVPSDVEPPGPVLPQLASAVDSGTLSDEHCAIITHTMSRIPTAVDLALRQRCEWLLVTTAEQADTNRLRDVAEQVRCITDPDGTLSDLATRDRMELTIGIRRGDGLTPIRGLLDDIGVETLRQAIAPLAGPRPAGPDIPDVRSPSARRCQALVEVLRRSLTFGDGPTAGGVRPHVSVTMKLSDLLPAIDASSPLGAVAPGAARLDYSGAVSPRTARLIACDAGILPIVLGGDGRPLDAAPEARFYSPAQRRALIARDVGCAFPGCDIPAGWTDAHHVTWFSRGGRTEVDNGCLLCGFHHHVIHREEWAVRMAADGRPEFIPPAWLDPAQRPRRNTYWQAVDLR